VPAHLRFRVLSVVYRGAPRTLSQDEFDRWRIAVDRAVRLSTRPVTASGYFSMSRAADVQASVTSRMNFA
jgi:hypothetical protein